MDRARWWLKIVSTEGLAEDLLWLFGEFWNNDSPTIDLEWTESWSWSMEWDAATLSWWIRLRTSLPRATLWIRMTFAKIRKFFCCCFILTQDWIQMIAFLTIKNLFVWECCLQLFWMRTAFVRWAAQRWTGDWMEEADFKFAFRFHTLWMRFTERRVIRYLDVAECLRMEFWTIINCLLCFLYLDCCILHRTKAWSLMALDTLNL